MKNHSARDDYHTMDFSNSHTLMIITSSIVVLIGTISAAMPLNNDAELSPFLCWIYLTKLISDNCQ